MLGSSSPSKSLATLDGKLQPHKARQVLSASVSTDALLHASQSEATPLSTAERLPLNSHNGNNNLNNKKKVLSSPVALNPLSPTRPGAKLALAMTGGLEQSPPERYAHRLEPAENVDLFSYASALCHRVTGRYLPRDLLQSDDGAQQREMERVQRDPELLRAIDAVRVLSTQFKDVARDTMGHRKELGHALFRIEESYLKLFEKLLELSLRLYWDYEQATEAQRKEDRDTAERWREQLERKSSECAQSSRKLAAREILQRAQLIELEDTRRQLRGLEGEVADQRQLEMQVRELMEVAARKRGLEGKLQDELAQLKKDQEIIKQEVALRKQEATLRKLEVVRESRSSQTEVDDDGLWDVQVWNRELPSHTVLFLSNLPKSVVAFPFYSVEQVIAQIEAIYDDKFASDKADEADGVAREELVSTAIYDGRTIVEVAGNRLAVRAEMRRAMLANDGKDTATTSFASTNRPDNDKNQQRSVAPRIVADVHKVLLLLMGALEQHREGIKKDLLALFDAGDVNHDCVLSVDEFSAIIRSRKPHFSDRRILRMFREALMGGVDQSFALSMEAFVVVCNDHGLASLLPEDRMQDPFALPVPKLEGRRTTRVSTSISPKQKSGSPRQMEDNTDTITTTFADIPEEIPANCEAETAVSSLVFTSRAEEVAEDEAHELDTSSR
ncbi:hypothetical protein BBJ28_00013658 [Nothophytophthora sp. Chile5]|nr:hypothetical protein BBJ28_00013658 [Nothophytophthora sp. Chile5]